MEVGTPSPDVLDLLFEDSCGLLNTDFSSVDLKHGFSLDPTIQPNDNMAFQSIDIGDLDLLSDNLFETLINSAEPNSFLDGEPLAKKRIVHTDHDYIAHNSPLSDSGLSSPDKSPHSDSGISTLSDDSLQYTLSPEHNMTDDQLQMFVTENYRDTSVEVISSGASPTSSSCGDSNTFDLFDVVDQQEQFEDYSLNSDLKLTHTVNTTTADLDDFDFSCSNDDNVSIDFSLDSLGQFGFGSDLESTDPRKIFVFSGGPNKKSTKNRGDSALPFTVNDIDPLININSTNYPGLQLTDEEKELLAREGMSLPNNMPLTRDEERILKAVRRKIRNKISAKESRKRKQGYVDGLEQRVKMCTQENRELQRKVELLSKQNVSLATQMKKLQTMMGKSKIPAQASTCAMVLLLSMALLVAPNCNPFGNEDENPESLTTATNAVRGKARSLLGHKNQDTTNLANNDEDPYGTTQRPEAPWVNSKVNGMTPAEIALDADDVALKVKTEVKSYEEELIEREDRQKVKLEDKYPELTRRIKSEPLADWKDIANVQPDPSDTKPVVMTIDRGSSGPDRGKENTASGTRGLEVQNGLEEIMEIDVEN